MTDRSRTTGDDRSQDTTADGFRRREFVALGAGATATMLAGCAGDGGIAPSDGSDGSGDSDGSDGSQTLTGNFRLLISDAPADIGDFDQLNVTLDEARIFEAQDGDDEEDGEEEDDAEDDEGEEDEDEEAEDEDEETEDDGSDQTGNETEEDDPANGTEEEDDADDEEAGDEGDDEDGEDDEESDRGFTVVALDGATVDLTQVIEDDAIAVFDGEIPAGNYEKIELSVTDVQGIVDGEEVDVKLPSEKLQITNGFEVTPDEPVSFVFDINVVKRGPNNGYILKPVISGSGVAGRDVEVNEIDEDDDEDDEGDDDEDDEDDEDDDDEEEDDDGEDDSEDDDGSTTGGNETDDGSSDAENGTTTNETES